MQRCWPAYRNRDITPEIRPLWELRPGEAVRRTEVRNRRMAEHTETYQEGNRPREAKEARKTYKPGKQGCQGSYRFKGAREAREAGKLVMTG